MPKAVYSNWLAGLAPVVDRGNARIGVEGSLREMRDIDIHDSPGYLTTDTTVSAVDSGDVLDDFLIDAVIDTTSTNAWAIDADGAVYKLAGGAYTTITQERDAVTIGSTRGEACVIYAIKGTDYFFYFYEDDAGRFDLSSTYDDDWLSQVPANAANLTDAPHPVVEGEDGKLYIGNGKDLARLDGRDGTDNGTFTTSALDLPEGWEITSLFKVRNLLGICAWKKVNPGSGYRTVSGIFYWNYVDSSFTIFVPIEDNKILASINWNGSVYILTTGRTAEAMLHRVTTDGAKFIARFRVDIGGTMHFFNVRADNIRNIMEVVDNRLLIALSDGGAFNNYIFAYGTRDPQLPPAVYVLGSAATGTENTAVFGMLKNLFSDIPYGSYTDGTNNYYVRFTGNASANAYAKTLYTEVDLTEGRTMRVNWVRVYMMPLVSGDDITVALETNYGTANSLQGGQITFDSDGAITEKELVPVGPLECHAFSPTVTWDSGQPAIARIVVDYDILE